MSVRHFKAVSPDVLCPEGADYYFNSDFITAIWSCADVYRGSDRYTDAVEQAADERYRRMIKARLKQAK